MTIYIPRKIYYQIKSFVLLCEYEISWIGKISAYRNGFLVEKIKLIHQTVSPASTILDASSLGLIYQEIIEEEGSLSGWKAWMHSHAKMDVFWSGTDISTIEDFDNETPNNNWFFSMEFNHEMKWLARLDIFHPIHIVHHIENMEIIEEEYPEIATFCQNEINRKVRTTLIKDKKIKHRPNLTDTVDLKKLVENFKLKKNQKILSPEEIIQDAELEESPPCSLPLLHDIN